MLKIEGWLKEEVKGKWILFSIIACLFLDFALNCFVILILNIFDITISAQNESGIPILTPSFPIMLICTAYFEELIFRAPLALLVLLTAERWKLRVIFIVAVALSILFGLVHGGIPNIFLQGIGGLLWSILFLKCGGYQKKFIKPLAVTTITHFLFNGILALICLSQGVHQL